MSELINKKNGRNDLHWKLLTSVSALALIASVYMAPDAKAEDDTDRPTVWIELGGQLSRLEDGQEAFAPPLMNGRPAMFASSQKFEKPPAYGLDAFGAISFQPDNSNWVFSASVRYGRSAADRHVIQQTTPQPFEKYVFGHQYTAFPFAKKFAETKASNSEQHAILDFQAGKDVGLGLFGNRDATSVISAGVRFAQFSSKTNISLKSDPDWHFNYKYASYFHVVATNGQVFHSNLASLIAQRSFHGLGPSLSWKASAPVAGNVQNGEIALDWGLNGAVLFGRQRTRTHHQSTARYFNISRIILSHSVVPQTISRFPGTPDHTRSRSVIVPNIGGFAGLSFKYTNAKFSIGYRGDFFFGAMDGGIDTAKSENRSFYGPFASVSVGLGG